MKILSYLIVHDNYQDDTIVLTKRNICIFRMLPNRIDMISFTDDVNNESRR